MGADVIFVENDHDVNFYHNQVKGTIISYLILRFFIKHKCILHVNFLDSQVVYATKLLHMDFNDSFLVNNWLGQQNTLNWYKYYAHEPTHGRSSFGDMDIIYHLINYRFYLSTSTYGISTWYVLGNLATLQTCWYFFKTNSNPTAVYFLNKCWSKQSLFVAWTTCTSMEHDFG